MFARLDGDSGGGYVYTPLAESRYGVRWKEWKREGLARFLGFVDGVRYCFCNVNRDSDHGDEKGETLQRREEV